MAKRTEITVETTSLFVLRGRNVLRQWCTQCAAEGEMISLENIGVISNLDQHVVEEWLNSEGLHRRQSADGVTLVCLNSLLARAQSARTK